ncbi:MAG: HD domain-containing phosphohydrolase [Candidatus Thiodiazotropha sp.]
MQDTETGHDPLLEQPGQELQKQVILVVDDTPENIAVMKGILVGQYTVLAATSGIIALKLVEKRKPDLILLDVMMPEMDGYEVCRHLKSNPETTHIPVIFVTAKTDSEDEQTGFDAGAVDYLAKPVHPSVVRARVKTHLALSDQQRACRQQVIARTQELEESQRAAIFMLGDAGHYNDTDTGVHIWRMAAYSAALARAVKWPVEEAKILELAAPMHDTGKIGISDEILKAPRKLTEEEWVIMKTHSMIGYRILSKSSSPLFQMAATVARHHHERWDGGGYPEGLAGDAIPECARIVAIADVFDALTMRRPYKEPWPVEQALATLRENAGSHFDPDLVAAFEQIIDEILEIKDAWDRKEQETDLAENP